MKQDIILSGVGGQGILSIATIIGWAALDQNLHLKQAEVHGMSQRGGEVQSNLRLSNNIIFSDLIPRGNCDLIISLEPMEALRYLPWLSGQGWIITNTSPFVNIPNYPDVEIVKTELEKVGRVIMIDVNTIAGNLKSPRSTNMVLLGAAAPFIKILEPKNLIDGIRNTFAAKGEKVTETNVDAFKAGCDFAQKHLKNN
ncbi:MAG: indolepyruvate oxidoreductase subunit beta [Bacteroidales bacterium]|nr:indolepyruvate oxidoreductase subunit beta [Bacteroidales bacterium]MDD3911270.1 indolepyruvate oxidoreductase subunit beta [Bacteroidales bacterium]MDD4420272.1 indolepyruvate oxidoreductase subunit beta [Bacteroidales bacterium]HNY06351.1 indolepyruvate oxidoreductase subunit beta [Candidatus Egerieousia sp.]